MAKQLIGEYTISLERPSEEHGKRVQLEHGQGWQWVTREYVSRVEVHNVGSACVHVETEQGDASALRPFVLRVRAELGEDLEQRERVNEGLQAAGELARAVITAHGRAAVELPGTNMVEDLELLAACAREFTAALDALPFTNRCCGNTGRHSEGGREFCSTCGQESPAKRWL